VIAAIKMGRVNEDALNQVGKVKIGNIEV